MKFLPLLFLLMTANVFAQTIDCQRFENLNSKRGTKQNVRMISTSSSDIFDIETIMEKDTSKHTRIITTTKYKKGILAGETNKSTYLYIDSIHYSNIASSDVWEYVVKQASDTLRQQDFANMLPKYDNCHKIGTETIDGKTYDIIETTATLNIETPKTKIDSTFTMRFWIKDQIKKAESINQNAKGQPIKAIIEYDVDIKPIEKPQNAVPKKEKVKESNSNTAQPRYKDGSASLVGFINANLVYPKAARDAKIEGFVHVNVTVEIDGSICDVKINKGLGYDCDEAAIEVVKKTSGNWLPALKFGKPIRASYRVPVKFKL